MRKRRVRASAFDKLEVYGFGAAALRETIIEQRKKGLCSFKDYIKLIILNILFLYAYVVTIILVSYFMVCRGIWTIFSRLRRKKNYDSDN